MNLIPCGINGCPRNNIGFCSLSDLPDDNPQKRYPSICSHYQWVIKNKKAEGGGENEEQCF